MRRSSRIKNLYHGGLWVVCAQVIMVSVHMTRVDAQVFDPADFPPREHFSVIPMGANVLETWELNTLGGTVSRWFEGRERQRWSEIGYHVPQADGSLMVVFSFENIDVPIGRFVSVVGPFPAVLLAQEEVSIKGTLSARGGDGGSPDPGKTAVCLPYFLTARSDAFRKGPKACCGMP